MVSKRSSFNVLFYVRRIRKNANGEVPLYARISCSGSKTEMSLNRGVDDAIWNPIRGSAIGSSKEARIINDYLYSVRTKLYELYQVSKEDGKKINPDLIKNLWQGKNLSNAKTLLGEFSLHMTQLEKVIGKDITQDTYNKFKYCKNHIIEFLKTQKVEDIPLENLKNQHLREFEVYMKSVKNCQHNSMLKYMKCIRKVVRICIANGYIKVDPFMNFKMAETKVDKPFLTEEELSTLIKKEFEIERLGQIRDCFVFSCLTGLAFIDLLNLTTDCIGTGTDGEPWILTKRHKTDNTCNIPLLPLSLQIVKRYENHPCRTHYNRLLPIPSNQKMNAYLKEIADLCGIKKNLTVHVARHTFATTVTLNNDVPIETVSKMLGHSSIKMTQVYARLLDKKVSQDMKKIQALYQ